MKVVRIAVIVSGILVFILFIGPFLVPVPPLEDVVPPQELADPDSHFIDVDGTAVHYKQYGVGQPVMILLHGFGASVFSWREVGEPLAAYGTVLAYDRPAFGLTERPLPDIRRRENAYDLPSQVDLLFGFMDALGVEQAVLIGNSAGGSVALAAALENPDRVQALVLVDAAIYEAGRSPLWEKLLYRFPQVDRLGPLIVRSIARTDNETILLAWHDPQKVTDEIIDGYRKPLQAENWDLGLWEDKRASVSDPGLADRLDEINLPVLVLSGNDDRIIPVEDSRQLAEHIKGAALVIFDNCGHVPQEECPQQFMEAVPDFVGSIGK